MFAHDALLGHVMVLLSIFSIANVRIYDASVPRCPAATSAVSRACKFSSLLPHFVHPFIPMSLIHPTSIPSFISLLTQRMRLVTFDNHFLFCVRPFIPDNASRCVYPRPFPSLSHHLSLLAPEGISASIPCISLYHFHPLPPSFYQFILLLFLCQITPVRFLCLFISTLCPRVSSLSSCDRVHPSNPTMLC